MIDRLDRRGKHNNRLKEIPPNIDEQIDKHIKSFSSKISRYNRNKSPNAKYLSPDLNQSIMHKLYLKAYYPLTYGKILRVKTASLLFHMISIVVISMRITDCILVPQN